jgi:hypothetical protein
MRKKIVSIFLFMLMLAAVTSVAGTLNIIKHPDTTDTIPNQNSNGPLLDPGDILFEYDVETPTGDNQCQGVEFDGEYFWITGGNNGTDPNKLYKLDSTGNLVDIYDQPAHCTNWGWRDLTFDGTYLYGSVKENVDQIDPATGQYTGVSFPGPERINRALAYDPVTDHFWTANFASLIYEFDRDGAVINTYNNTLSIYGLAWDDFSKEGPWLWTYSQDGSPRVLISQFDPRTGNYTGVTYQGVYHDPSDTAGGLCFYEDDGKAVLVGLTINSPDLIFGMDVTPPPTPEIEIGNITGGLFKVNAVIKNVGDGNASDVNWNISVKGGILGKIDVHSEGIIASLTAGQETTVSTDKIILGLGSITVEVKADEADKTTDGFVLLFVIILE